VCILGRPLGDLDFSANLGVSQSRAGDVVEKHRVIWDCNREGKLSMVEC
jgi:hypothetical protein